MKIPPANCDPHSHLDRPLQILLEPVKEKKSRQLNSQILTQFKLGGAKREPHTKSKQAITLHFLSNKLIPGHLILCPP
jgi:hypothetical protein